MRNKNNKDFIGATLTIGPGLEHHGVKGMRWGQHIFGKARGRMSFEGFGGIEEPAFRRAYVDDDYGRGGSGGSSSKMSNKEAWDRLNSMFSTSSPSPQSNKHKRVSVSYGNEPGNSTADAWGQAQRYGERASARMPVRAARIRGTVRRDVRGISDELARMGKDFASKYDVTEGNVFVGELSDRLKRETDSYFENYAPREEVPNSRFLKPEYRYRVNRYGR